MKQLRNLNVPLFLFLSLSSFLSLSLSFSLFGERDQSATVSPTQKNQITQIKQIPKTPIKISRVSEKIINSLFLFRFLFFYLSSFPSHQTPFPLPHSFVPRKQRFNCFRIGCCLLIGLFFFSFFCS